MDALEEHLTDLIRWPAPMLISEAMPPRECREQSGRDGGNKPESNIWNAILVVSAACIRMTRASDDGEGAPLP